MFLYSFSQLFNNTWIVLDSPVVAANGSEVVAMTCAVPIGITGPSTAQVQVTDALRNPIHSSLEVTILAPISLFPTTGSVGTVVSLLGYVPSQSPDQDSCFFEYADHPAILEPILGGACVVPDADFVD